MLEIASQITICLLIAALIGFIMGYIIGKMGNKKIQKTVNNIANSQNPSIQESSKSIEEEIETLITTVSEETESEIEILTEEATQNAVEALAKVEEIPEEKEEAEKPELLDAPREDTKDALTQIKGIGPKVEEKLNEAGIYHFEQIANWSESNIQWLEIHTTFAHRAKKDLWVNQAKALI